MQGILVLFNMDAYSILFFFHIGINQFKVLKREPGLVNEEYESFLGFHNLDNVDVVLNLINFSRGLSVSTPLTLKPPLHRSFRTRPSRPPRTALRFVNEQLTVQQFFKLRLFTARKVINLPVR